MDQEKFKKQIEAQLKDKNVFLATPCYGGQCTSQYLFSMFYLSQAMTEVNLKHILGTSSNESLVTRARNRLLRSFLDTECTHLFFIDSDISFKPLDVIRLLLHDQPVVCGAYPMKGVHLESLVGQTIENVEQAKRAVSNYVINFVKSDQDKFAESEGKPFEIKTNNGLVEIMDAGTGFMCIKREVIEKIIEAHPEIAYTSEEDNREWYAVFDCIIDGGRYLSEDYTFCRRWQKLGGNIWLDPDIVLDHVGTYTYPGSPMFFWGDKPEIKNYLN